MLIYFLKYETIETHARAFLTLNISAIGRVYSYFDENLAKSFNDFVYSSKMFLNILEL